MAKNVSEALGVDCVPLPADDLDASLRRSVSLLAYASFDFHPVELLGEQILVARPKECLAPARLVRLLDEVDAASSHPVVCGLRSMTPYLRSLLLRERRGFVTDDGQAYVPGFLRLAPRRRLERPSASNPWGPAELQAFIYLLSHIGEDVTASGLRAVTGMSATSARRALSTVASVAPVERTVGGATGRTNMWCVTDAEAFVECGTEAFGKPVRRRLQIGRLEADGLPIAGLSALARRSLLAAPRMERRACGVRQAKELREVNPCEMDVPVCEVLVLSYDPTPFVENGMADLYTMVRTVDRADERVDSAVEEATAGCPWLRLA